MATPVYAPPERRRYDEPDDIIDPWAGMEAGPEIGEVEVEARTPEQINAGMRELLRRIDEREGDPRVAARDYAAELAMGANARGALAPAMGGATTPMSPVPPAVQSPPTLPPAVPPMAQGAPTTPPAMPGPAPMAPPAQPPAAPGSPGAQAAELQAGPQPGMQPVPQRPDPAAPMAKGARPVNASGIQAQMGSGPGLVAQGPSFEQQVADAQRVDDRRERWRRILKGMSALLAAGTGNVGLLLPGLVGASLVPDSDEEETLRGLDTREQAIGTENARRQNLLDQLAQRREAQAQNASLQEREMIGQQEDRALRTGIAQAEEGREREMLDPQSSVSARNRSQFREWIRTAPPEVQQAVDMASLDGLSATEILTLQDELSSNYNSRQIGGGRGGASSGLARGQQLAGVNVAPDAFVLAVQQASPGMTPEQARQSGNLQWLALPENERNGWASSAEGVRMSTALNQNLPGYEQTNPGAVSPAQFGEAQDILAGEESLGVAMDRAISAAERIEALPLAEQAAARAAGAAGLTTNDDLAEFDDARRAIISSLNRMAGGGTMDASEYARWDATLPSLSTLRGMAPGSARRALQAAADRARETAQAEMRARGYRRTGGQSQGAAPQQSGVTLRFRNADGRTRTITVPEARRDAAIAAARRNGYEVQP